MMNRRIIWGALGLLTLLFAYFGISGETYNSAPILLPFLFAFFSTIFITQAIADFDSVNQIIYPLDEDEKTVGRKAAPFISILGLIIISVIIFMRAGSLKDRVFDEKGIQGFATVIDGSTVTKRKGGSTSSITITFDDKNGAIQTQLVEITSDEFSKVTKDMIIPIVYVPTNTTIIKPLISDADIKKYCKVEQRNVGINDLTQILQITHDRDSVGRFLNKISVVWQYDNTTKNDTWGNSLRSEGLSLHDSAVYYVRTQNNLGSMSGKDDFSKELSRNGFERFEGDLQNPMSNKMYRNKDYVLSLQNIMYEGKMQMVCVLTKKENYGPLPNDILNDTGQSER